MAHDVQVAALYVREQSIYHTMPGVECWPQSRDARKYAGPWPVVAHPPCNRWGGFASWYGNTPGDDGGCGDAAVTAVRQFGGVLEHPAKSGLWARWMMPRPGTGRDLWGGATYALDQRCYGHRALKPTWLYVVGLPCDLAVKRWQGGPCVPVTSMGTPERERTPRELAEMLVTVAREVGRFRAVRSRGVCHVA